MQTKILILQDQPTHLGYVCGLSLTDDFKVIHEIVCKNVNAILGEVLPHCVYQKSYIKRHIRNSARIKR